MAPSTDSMPTPRRTLRLLPSSRRTALDRVVDHLVEVAKILEAGNRPAEARAAGRIAADLDRAVR